MTPAEAEHFLSTGRARYGVLLGWQIAHEVAGELEWFSVTEADAQLLDVAAGRRLGEERAP